MQFITDNWFRFARVLDRWLFWISGKLPPFIAALVVVTLVLGCWGFHEYLKSEGTQRSPVDPLYKTLQLFALQVDPMQSMPLTIDIARFVAALASYTTLVAVIAAVSNRRFERLRLWLAGNHAVVCRLGEYGVKSVSKLCDESQVVVIVEPDRDHKDIPACRKAGAIVITGCAINDASLQLARTGRARLLLSLFQSDCDTIDTVVAAKQISQGRRSTKQLVCVAHLLDPELADQLRQSKPLQPCDEFRLEVVNFPDVCARAMLREPPTETKLLESKRLLVVGLGDKAAQGEALVLRAAKFWRLSRSRNNHGPDNAGRLRVTVIDGRASERINALTLRNPFLEEVCEFSSVDVSLSADGIINQQTLRDMVQPLDDIAACYVCATDDMLALTLTRACEKVLPKECRIAVRMESQTHGVGLLASMLTDTSRVTIIGVQERNLEIARAIRPEMEFLAVAIHQHYWQSQKDQGFEQYQKPSLDYWDKISEFHRESNRSQAEAFDDKLSSVGCERKVCSLPRLNLFQFSDNEIETLARKEHERWCNFMSDNDWSFGAVRDDANSKHPDLVEWEQLHTKENDRAAMRMLPHVLAEADYKIVYRNNDNKSVVEEQQ